MALDGPFEEVSLMMMMMKCAKLLIDGSSFRAIGNEVQIGVVSFILLPDGVGKVDMDGSELVRVWLGFVGKVVVEKISHSGSLCLFWANDVDGFSGPWLGGGDLNEILHQYEKSDEFDYRELVPGTWNSASGHRINGVQDNIRQAISILKGWNRDVYKRTLGAIKKKKYELAHLDTGWHFNQQKDKEIDVLMYKDEKYWASLAKNSWMMLGDKNSAFFHQSASHRKKMNLIRGPQGSALLMDLKSWPSMDLGVSPANPSWYPQNVSHEGMENVDHEDV
ncbi:hypothetical protein F8388_006015 [Cannabis sativa]|uniref:Uncharacterized protein n=1 Tax=Cannabis sativa TaxID=3483 RepID=A0A7J6H7D8_CANSA|nr:hypothetical protein F8388_006015 [Cannabis sativa]